MMTTIVDLLELYVERDKYGRGQESFRKVGEAKGYLISYTTINTITNNREYKANTFKFISRERQIIEVEYIKYNNAIYKIKPITELYKKGYIFEVTKYA